MARRSFVIVFSLCVHAIALVIAATADLWQPITEWPTPRSAIAFVEDVPRPVHLEDIELPKRASAPTSTSTAARQALVQAPTMQLTPITPPSGIGRESGDIALSDVNVSDVGSLGDGVVGRESVSPALHRSRRSRRRRSDSTRVFARRNASSSHADLPCCRSQRARRRYRHHRCDNRRARECHSGASVAFAPTARRRGTGGGASVEVQSDAPQWGCRTDRGDRDRQLQTRLEAVATSGTIVSGRSVMRASTPQLNSRRASASSSTVHT